MKKLLKVINGIILAVIIALSFTLVCCGDKPNNNSSESGGINQIREPTEGNKEVPETEYFTVVFDSDGGSPVESQKVEKGKTAKQPKAPVKISSYSEYEFTGWYSNGKKWDFDNDVVAGDIILKATWKLTGKYGPEILP